MTDYTVGDTIYRTFTTRAFATGIPTVLAGTPTVSAIEDNSATPITAGITLGVDHSSVVGLNLLTIAATAGNGYESGKDYNLYISAGTVGGVSVVGEVVACFSIGRSAAAVDLANGTDGLGALKTLLDAIPTTAMRGTDSALTDKAGFSLSTAGILAVWHQALSAVVTAGSVGKLLKDEITSVRMAALTDWIDGGRLDLLLDAIPTTAMRGTDNAALASVLGALNDAAAAGDPTASDTLVQYIKQLINVLVGTTGVTTMPAAAAPANNVSLAEIIRAIYDDSNSLDGTKIPDTLSLANINAEVDTALATTTYAEPAQGAPAATASLKDKIGYLYKFLRNKADNDGSTVQIYNDDASTVDHKSTVSEAGGTVTRGEFASGP